MHKFRLKQLIFIIIIGIIVIFGIPIIINWGITYVDFSIGDNNSWLGFWGTWLGAIMGGIITFVGLKITIDYNNKQQSENIRVNFRPYLNIKLSVASGDEYNRSENKLFINSKEVDTRYFDNEIYTIFYVKMDIVNIGLGSAIDVQLNMIDCDISYMLNMVGFDKIVLAIDKSEVKTFYLQFIMPKEFQMADFRLITNFSDIISQNKYEQSYTMFISQTDLCVHITTVPKLIN